MLHMLRARVTAFYATLPHQASFPSRSPQAHMVQPAAQSPRNPTATAATATWPAYPARPSTHHTNWLSNDRPKQRHLQGCTRTPPSCGDRRHSTTPQPLQRPRAYRCRHLPSLTPLPPPPCAASADASAQAWPLPPPFPPQSQATGICGSPALPHSSASVSVANSTPVHATGGCGTPLRSVTGSQPYCLPQAYISSSTRSNDPWDTSCNIG